MPVSTAPPFSIFPFYFVIIDQIREKYSFLMWFISHKNFIDTKKIEGAKQLGVKDTVALKENLFLKVLIRVYIFCLI